MAFEKLYLAGTLYAEHEDLKDAEQTVTVPKILTSAYEERTGSHTAGAGSEITVKDLVKYSNLTPGNYTVRGMIMSRKTGKAIQSGGKKVTAEASFSANCVLSIKNPQNRKENSPLSEWEFPTFRK